MRKFPRGLWHGSQRLLLVTAKAIYLGSLFRFGATDRRTKALIERERAR